MDTIGTSKLWAFLDGSDDAQPTQVARIRKEVGYRVTSFLELAHKIAELQFRNRDYILLFRGQSKDHRNVKKNTSLKPSLFRPAKDSHSNPGPQTLESRFATLREAERILVQRYQEKQFLGGERIERQRILRWAILQHYEVCPTPLLDVTHSLRIATSFASFESNESGEAFLYVLGVPNLSGSITASAEAGLQAVRLASVCPPSAVRPHIQEGYLLGEYPDIADFEQKACYKHFEIDFGRRIISKFRFSPRTFWLNKDFPRIPKSALYPDENDPLVSLAREIRDSLRPLR